MTKWIVISALIVFALPVSFAIFDISGLGFARSFCLGSLVTVALGLVVAAVYGLALGLKDHFED